MPPGPRDEAAEGVLSRSAGTATGEGEPRPIGLKLCCAVGVVVWFDAVTFLASAVATGEVGWLAAFTAAGTAYSCLLYGLWERQRWAWGGTIVFFTFVTALSVASLRFGRAIVASALIAYLSHAESTFG